VTVAPLRNPDPTWHCRVGRVRLRQHENVVQLGTPSSINYDPAMILANALSDGMSSVVVLGYDLNNEDYFAASIADGGTVLWLMERAKQRLMEIATAIERTGPTAA